jgi:hypothetical protein
MPRHHTASRLRRRSVEVHMPRGSKTSTPGNRNARPSTSRRDTRSAACLEKKLSGAAGPRSTRFTAEARSPAVAAMENLKTMSRCGRVDGREDRDDECRRLTTSAGRSQAGAGGDLDRNLRETSRQPAMGYSTASYKRSSRGLPDIGCSSSRYRFVCGAAACASSAFRFSHVSMIVK